jgi:hypothetical protein
MYTINYSYGIARVYLVGSPLPGCQPQDKRTEAGWWETDVTTLPPEGTMIRAGDGKRYQVDYCHALSPGCMGSR